MSAQPSGSDLGYAGDKTPKETWDALVTNSQAVLVDVRSKAEWAFVGVCDLSDCGKEPLLVEWARFSDGKMQPNADFATDITQRVSDKSVSVYFLCRSGARSAAAAKTLTQLGYLHCYNITSGFEGDLDSGGHRGVMNGWKACRLPWRQS